jgi:hypothetical protein
VPAWHIRGQLYPFYGYGNPPALLYLQMCAYILHSFSNGTVLFRAKVFFDQNKYGFETYTSFLYLKIIPNDYRIENICQLISGL